MSEIQRKLPWLLLALLPLLAIGLNQLRKGGRLRVEIAGAGPIHQLKASQAPDTLRYAHYTVASEPIEASLKRIEARLRLQPAVILIGLDGTKIQSDERAKVQLSELVRRAQNAATISVVASYAPSSKALHRWWRGSVCRASSRVVCVDIRPYADKPAELRKALNSAVLDGVQRLKALRATTQVGR